MKIPGLNETMKNSIYSLSAKAVNMIFFFVLDILCARWLAPDAYGEWVYFYAIITIIYSVAWFGVNISGKIFIAKSENSEQMEIFISALALRLLISVLLTIIYIIAVVCVGKTEILDITKYGNLYALLLLGSALVFLNSFSEFFKEIFIGLIYFKGLFLVNFCEYAGYFVFGTAGLLLIGDAKGVVVGFIVSLAVTVFVGFWIVLSRYHPERIELNKRKMWSEGKKIFHYAKYIALSSVGAIILTEIDTFMIGYFKEGYDTAIYSVAKQFSSKAIHINLALSTSLMPAFANITYANVREKKGRFNKVMLCNALVTFVISLMFIIFGKSVIKILYGEEYIYAANVLYYLLPFYVMSSFSKFLVLFLDYQNKAKIRSFVFAGTIIFDIILNVALIPKMGAAGAAIATDVSLLPYIVFLLAEVGIIFKGYLDNGKNNFIGKLRRK